MKKFLSALYGGRTDDGQVGFYVEEGVILQNLLRLRPSKLLSEEVGIISPRIGLLVLTVTGTRLLRAGILPKWSCWSMYVRSLPPKKTNANKNSKLVPHSRHQLQRRTLHPQPTHHRPRPFHPSPTRLSPPRPPRRGNDQNHPPSHPPANQHISLGALGETQRSQ